MHVRDFGVVGDGIADDRASIERALADAQSLAAVHANSTNLRLYGAYVELDFSGQVELAQPVLLGNFPVDNKPVGASPGTIAYFKDGNMGGKCIALYDGNAWYRLLSGLPISKL